MTLPASDPLVDRILTALGDLAPACRAWAPPPECCCWSGIAMAIDTVRKFGSR